MGLLDTLFGTGDKEARRLNQENMDFIKSIFGNLSDQDANSLFGMLNQAFAKGTPLMEQAVGEVGKGYDQALSTASNYGKGANASILAREKQRLGNSRGQLAASGLYSSTMGPNLARGIGADTDRALSGVADQQAGLMSQLQANRGQAVGGSLQQLAQYLASKPAMAGQMGGNLANILGGFQFQGGDSLFSQFSGLLGTGVGAMPWSDIMGFGEDSKE